MNFGMNMMDFGNLKVARLETWMESASGERKTAPVVSAKDQAMNMLQLPTSDLEPGDWLMKIAIWVEDESGNASLHDTKSIPVTVPAKKAAA